MAATAISLRFRSHKIRAIRDPSFSMLFSSSSTPEPPSNNEEESQSSFSSYFSDVKSSVNQQQQYPFSRKPISPISTQKPSNMASLEEINKNLFEFRRLSAPPPPAASDNSYPSHQISFQELYKRDAISKGEESTNPNEPIKLTERSFKAIRGSLTQFQDKNQDGGGIGINKMAKTTSRSKFTESLLGPRKSTSVAGGTEPLPASVFGKESEKKSAAQSETMKTEFVKNYDYGELGDKLRSLRPEEDLNKGEKWFSLGELNERLVKLRDMEEKEMKSRIGGFYFNDLRESLVKLKISDNKAKKNSYHHKVETLSQLGGTPDFMLSPPKDDLVIKYFHPDNMSSAEKMKIELKKVRNEFKMSESDCGSARVQVAQLTTKIKHLSTALHKKDKHSRKGLQAMVQQRKKLLKYLRRTDWDSYCLVLSKLGLRDNPDYKN